MLNILSILLLKRLPAVAFASSAVSFEQPPKCTGFFLPLESKKKLLYNEPSLLKKSKVKSDLLNNNTPVSIFFIDNSFINSVNLLSKPSLVILNFSLFKLKIDCISSVILSGSLSQRKYSHKTLQGKDNKLSYFPSLRRLTR